MKRLLSAVVVAAWLAPACSRPAPAPKRLVIAAPRGVPSLDLYDPAQEGVSAAILANVYETLVEMGPDLSLRPGLAESWHSPDPLTWVLRLRRGVRFHDGRHLTASDVVAVLERGRREPWTRGELQPITQVETRGTHEIVLRTRVPFEGLLARFTYLFVDGGAPAAGAASPGTGPYRVKSWSPGSLVLEAFDGYRTGAPPIREVEFLTLPDAAERARQLEAGRVQLISDVRPLDVPRLAARPDLRTVSRPGVRVVFLAVDCQRSGSPHVSPPANPLRDARVREALDRALDRGGLVAGPLHGYADVARQLPGLGDTGYEPGLPAPGLDRAEARRLLAAAGHPRGFDLTLDIMAGAGDEVFEALASQLALVGVRLHARVEPPGRFLARIEARDTSAYLMRWTNERGSIQDSYVSLLHTQRDNLGVMNGGRWSEPRFDALLDRVAGLRSHEERASLLRQATRLVAEERPILPLYYQQDLFAFTEGLQFDPRRQRALRAAGLDWLR